MPLSCRGRRIGGVVGGVAEPTVFDYTTFTEVDVSSDLTVSASQITVSTMAKNINSYVYNDMGVDNYSGNFSFNLGVSVTASTTNPWGSFCFWALANSLSSPILLSDCLMVTGYRDAAGDLIISIKERLSGASAVDESTATLSLATQYYLTIERDESVGTYGTIYCRIYSDSTRYILVETLSVALSAKQDFRYLYAVASVNSSTSDVGDGAVYDLTETAF